MKFCDIKSRNDLADLLKIPHHKLTHILFVKGIDNCYTSFEIPKKNGGVRTICAPNDDLKGIQIKLADALWLYVESVREEKNISANISHAFEKGKNIITNASIHRNKRYVLNVDLENFFGSFHIGRVIGYFEKNRNFCLPHEAAVTIAQIACYNKVLPQGAPTSPIITNLICESLDYRILQLAKKYKVDYTRYADDLTFSTNRAQFLEEKDLFLEALTALIKRAGFKINPSKTRMLFKDSRQEVTGLVVNKKIGVNRKYVKETRSMAHRLYTTGEFEIDGERGSIKQLEGRFAFIDQIDRYNNKKGDDKKKHHCYSLNSREEDYRRFLFFTHFFDNDKPVVITEGKTDVLYLKAALKSLCDSYPELVEKDENGKCIYKISFFRKTRKWKHLFGISTDGGDALSMLYYYFVNGNNVPNYLEYFNKVCNRNMKNAVVFLFDNETKSDRPLKIFMGKVKTPSGKKKQFSEGISWRLIDESKLYLLTNPLVKGLQECEIEDLFCEETLNQKINGKTFCRKDDFDTSRYYGKDHFARYVYENYKDIDFSGFIPLLNALKEIVVSQ